MAAMTWIRANTKQLGMSPKTFEKNDFHVHIPAGAIPKDGPSAGTALTCSLVSLLSGFPVADELAMTGEITLRGKVLPVGGVKEKVIAAKSAGIKRVILPSKNEKDLIDVTKTVRDALQFHFVDEIEDVLKIAFADSLKDGEWPGPGVDLDAGEEDASQGEVVNVDESLNPDEDTIRA